MKIIDEHGNPIETPDLTKGYLKPETQTVYHDAVAGVEEVSHYEYKTYPNGGRDRWKVVDVPGVDPQPAWDEEVPVQRYIQLHRRRAGRTGKGPQGSRRKGTAAHRRRAPCCSGSGYA